MRTRRWTALTARALAAVALAMPLAGIASGGAMAGPAGASAKGSPRCASVRTQRTRVTRDSSLTGIAVPARCNAWAVGWNFNGRGTQTLIEHWNGASWKQVPSPSPAHQRNGDNELSGVAASSFRSAWAVGSDSAGSSADRTLIEHWNGSAWRRVSSPSPGASGLNAVATASAGAWAVGWRAGHDSDLTLIEHWNGTSWTHVPSPNPATVFATLTGVASTSAGHAWAVGYSDTPQITRLARVRTLIERWNGTSWRLVPSPSPAARPRADNRLSAVTALSSDSAWAVGYSRLHGRRSHALIEHWNGSAWTQVASPGPSRKAVVLTGVAAISADNAWAVGTCANSFAQLSGGSLPGAGNRTLILHWNGKSWRQVRSPNQAARLARDDLSGVAAVSGSNAWAVGNHAGFGAESEPVTAHWSNGAWHRVATPVMR